MKRLMHISILVAVAVTVAAVYLPAHAAAGDFSLLHEFSGDDGSSPYGNLTLSGTTVYGTAYMGGQYGQGVIYKMDNTGGGFTLLHEFAGGNDDGINPSYGTLSLSGSTLYGTAAHGGDLNGGVVYSINTDGTGFTLLHEFGAGNDGDTLLGGVALSGTTLYGMTYTGSNYTSGKIYKMETDGSGYTILHSLTGGASNGYSPFGDLKILGTTMYGMTNMGGSLDFGVVFKIETNGDSFTILHDFAGTPMDGRAPFGSLTIDGTTMYGMTANGGSADMGTVFKMNTDGSGLMVLHNFDGSSNDGSYPNGNLTVSGSTIYGMTSMGGGENKGTIFTLGTDGSGFVVFHTLTGGADDGAALAYSGSLAQDGTKLYGGTAYGGDTDNGVVFSQRVPHVYDGGGEPATWSTAGNWREDIPPSGSGDEVLVFSNSSLTPSNDMPVNTQFSKIIFGNEAGGFNLMGNGIVLTDGIENQSGSNVFMIPVTVNSGVMTIANYGDNLQLSGPVTNNGSAIAVKGGGATFISGGITGTGGLTKEGTGTLEIAGPNDFSGTTNINAGTVNLSGSITQSSVYVQQSGVLRGAGTAAVVNVSSGGTISPGNGVGAMTAGTLNWWNNGKYWWELSNAEGQAGEIAGYDLLNVTGALNIYADSVNKFTINLSTMGADAANFNEMQNYSWTIASAAGGISGFNPLAFTINSANFDNDLQGEFSLSLAAEDTELKLAYTYVPLNLTGERLYFWADDGTHGRELMTTDGTNVSLIADISPPSIPNMGGYKPALYNGKLYFSEDDSTHGSELVSVEADGNVQMVADNNPGAGAGAGGGITAYNNKLYFSGNDGGDTGFEPYSYDGTTISQVADINPVEGSGPEHFTVYNGKLYFHANDGSGNGAGLFSYDGATTALISYVYPSGMQWMTTPMYVYDGKLYMNVYVPGPGNVLASYDGTNLVQIDGGSVAGARYFQEYNGKLYFQSNGVALNGLTSYDGTNVTMYDFYPGNPGEEAQYLTVYDNKLYFGLNTGMGNYLHSFDGTNAEVISTDSQYPGEMAVYGNKLYYNSAGPGGYELWSYDGIAAALFAEINQLSGSSSPGGFLVANLGASGALGPPPHLVERPVLLSIDQETGALAYVNDATGNVTFLDGADEQVIGPGAHPSSYQSMVVYRAPDGYRLWAPAGSGWNLNNDLMNVTLPTGYDGGATAGDFGVAVEGADGIYFNPLSNGEFSAANTAQVVAGTEYRHPIMAGNWIVLEYYGADNLSHIQLYDYVGSVWSYLSEVAVVDIDYNNQTKGAVPWMGFDGMSQTYYLTWQAWDGTDWEIFYQSYDVGTATWGAITQVTNNDNSSGKYIDDMYPEVGNDGTVVWMSYDDWDIYQWTEAGGTQLVAGGAGDQMYPAVGQSGEAWWAETQGGSTTGYSSSFGQQIDTGGQVPEPSTLLLLLPLLGFGLRKIKRSARL